MRLKNYCALALAGITIAGTFGMTIPSDVKADDVQKNTYTMTVPASLNIKK